MRTWFRGRSVRARLTTVAAMFMTLALCAAAVLLVWGLHRSLLGSVDSTAKERARDAARLPATDGVLPTSAEADNVVQVVDASGSVVASTANVVGEGRLFTFAPNGDSSVRSVKHVAVPDAADSYRVAVVAAANGRTVYAAVPDDDAREAVRRLAVGVTAGLPVVVAVLSLMTWLLVGRALRPAEVAARKQKEFVADAAHELRSPLAAIRAQLEVSGSHPDDAYWRASVPGLLADVDRLTQLTEDLLHLARMEGGRTARRVIDLDDIVFAAVTQARRGTRLSIDVTDVSAAQVDGDAAALSRLVRNLLDNAVRHASTRVTVGLRTTGGSAVLNVADDGAGIPVADRERVFERFTRLDDARTRSTGGAGLGLAIVREVARAHGGTAEIADDPSGATFVVRLPLAPGSAVGRSRAKTHLA